MGGEGKTGVDKDECRNADVSARHTGSLERCSGTFDRLGEGSEIRRRFRAWMVRSISLPSGSRAMCSARR
jgi:hypothetical protein